MEARLEGVKSYEGTLSQGSERLADWLEFRSALYRAYGKLAVYAGLAYSVDTNDEEAAARYDRVRGLGARLGAATAFAEPELVAIGFDTLRSWLVRDSRLTVYGHYLERLERKAPHLRSAEVEELLGALADPFGTASSVHGVLANTDLPFAPAEGADGETFEITQGNIRKLLGSPDRALRKSAYENYADAHLTFKNTMATTLSAGVKQNTLVARARRYDSVLEGLAVPREHSNLSVLHLARHLQGQPPHLAPLLAREAEDVWASKRSIHTTLLRLSPKIPLRFLMSSRSIGSPRR